MRKSILYIIILLSFGHVQGQDKSEDFTDLISDLECFSLIVTKGLENKSWSLNKIGKTDSCSNYISNRDFKIINDTLIITRTTKSDTDKLKETRVNIVNDSIAIAEIIFAENHELLSGKSKKKLAKEKQEINSNTILLRLLYRNGKSSISFYQSNMSGDKDNGTDGFDIDWN